MPSHDISGNTNTKDQHSQTTPNIFPLEALNEHPNEYNYLQVNDMIEELYNPLNINNSTICDILALYMKGQKIIYSEAKTFCEQRLNSLMLPSIFLTVLASVLNLMLQDTSYGVTCVSGLNGFTAFILALINYLKLDARAEAHRTTAYKFDKLESNLVFKSGKTLFLNAESSNFVKIIEEAENNIKEIKETNQFILPESIRHNYPKLCNINVFAEVKKIMNMEMMYRNDLKNSMNDRIRLEMEQTEDQIAKQANMAKFQERERQLVTLIIGMKDEYLGIDTIFEDEIQTNRLRIKNSWQLLGCLKL